MNITYLIGNGFDISVGLHTKYSEFLEYYRAKKSNTPLIQKFKDNISENQELWADAEIAFGEYTKEFSNLEEFDVCYYDFCSELCKYLRGQEERLIQPNDNIKSKFCAAISAFTKYLRRAEIVDINNVIRHNFYETHKYNFINFNYTRAFDSCYRYAQKAGSQFAFHEDSGRKYPDVLGDLIHIHGDLDSPILMGVNDESQISNKALLKIRKFPRKFIKPETNIALKNLIDERAQEIIKASTILIIFGMSLGVTDKKWWQLIASWLKNNASSHLIIYTRFSGFNINLGGIELDHEEDIQNLFLSYSNFNEQEINPLIDRIHIVTNKDLFNFTLVNNESDTIQKSA